MGYWEEGELEQDRPTKILVTPSSVVILPMRSFFFFLRTLEHIESWVFFFILCQEVNSMLVRLAIGILKFTHFIKKNLGFFNPLGLCTV